jgi:hypothetical protein
VLLQLSDADGWLDGLAAGGDALLPAAAAAAAAEDEALAPEEASAVLAARGAVADTDVLQVHVATAGPFSRRGTYRWVLQQHALCSVTVNVTTQRHTYCLFECAVYWLCQ